MFWLLAAKLYAVAAVLSAKGTGPKPVIQTIMVWPGWPGEIVKPKTVPVVKRLISSSDAET